MNRVIRIITRTLLLTLFGVAGTGCPVDLERESAILSLLVLRTGNAEAISVVLDEEDDFEPFTATFTLTSSDAERLPDITAPAGLIALTAESLDDTRMVLQRKRNDIRLLAGVNEINLDFGGGSNQPEPIFERNEIVTAEARFDTWDAVPPNFDVTIITPSTAIEDAITRLSKALGEQPSTLTLRTVELTSEDPYPGSSNELENIWSGQVSVRLTGGNVDVALLPFTPIDDQVSKSYTTPINATSWLTGSPPNVEVQLSGPRSIDEPDLPLRLSIRLDLAGAP